MSTRKPLLLLALLVAGTLTATAQKELGPRPDMPVAPVATTASPTAYLSPAAAMLRVALDRLGRDVKRSDSDLIEHYALQRKGCRYYVQALLELPEGHSTKDLSPYKVKIVHTVGNSFSVLIPTKRLAALIDSGVAEVIHISFPVEHKQ
ncbi:MAG: hypothetical protein J6I49_04645 [Bacteroidales bacterium]|nr:hypothetical protein [Bacteroidales bacterium]